MDNIVYPYKEVLHHPHHHPHHRTHFTHTAHISPTPPTSHTPPTPHTPHARCTARLTPQLDVCALEVLELARRTHFTHTAHTAHTGSPTSLMLARWRSLNLPVVMSRVSCEHASCTRLIRSTRPGAVGWQAVGGGGGVGTSNWWRVAWSSFGVSMVVHILTEVAE